MTPLEIKGPEWRAVSTKLIAVELVWRSIVIVPFLIACAVLWAVGLWAGNLWWIPAIVAFFAANQLVDIALVPRSVRATGYSLRDDDLLFRRGILFHRVVAIPYGRMQLVDIERGPLLRAFGLSELKFVTAASSAGVTIPGLLENDAEQLRDHFVAVAESRRAGL